MRNLIFGWKPPKSIFKLKKKKIPAILYDKSSCPRSIFLFKKLDVKEVFEVEKQKINFERASKFELSK